MTLDRALAELVKSQGADYYGVADLALAREAILAQGGPSIAAYPRAISVGIRLMDGIVDQLPQRAERAVASNYRYHAYDVVNDRLDQIASRVAGMVQSAGHRALPIPSRMRINDVKLESHFSHKMAAHMAGLGWIGKCCLLVTPEAGPRVRWTTVLTEAPLRVTGDPMDERCGTCRECVDICPPKAVTGRSFREDEPREARYDAHACERYQDAMEESTGYRVCGMCLYVCPYGREGEIAKS